MTAIVEHQAARPAGKQVFITIGQEQSVLTIDV